MGESLEKGPLKLKKTPKESSKMRNAAVPNF
jgi:hypothetical protein